MMVEGPHTVNTYKTPREQEITTPYRYRSRLLVGPEVLIAHRWASGKQIVGAPLGFGISHCLCYLSQYLFDVCVASFVMK